MSVEVVGNGIKTNLGNVSGLKRIYAPNETPGAVYEFPCAIIQHGGTDYTETMGGSHDRHTFRILVLVTDQDTPSAFNRLLDFLARTGSDSIVEKLRDDATFNSSASDMILVSNSGQSVITWGGIQYLGTSFELEVYE